MIKLYLKSKKLIKSLASKLKIRLKDSFLYLVRFLQIPLNDQS